ncbi:MAG: hypothetical protein CML13_02205 [Puniceicoccaceae bacterium]|nr:hypothetical protein [Puniceicoccaceae bacterium]
MLSACFVNISLSAQAILSDDFNSYTSGAALPSSTSNSSFTWFTKTNDASRRNTVEQDSNNYFGEGTANQYLHMAREAPSQNSDVQSQQFTSQQTGVLSFDYYVNDSGDFVDSETDSLGDSGFRVTLMNGPGDPFTYGIGGKYGMGGFFITGSSIVNAATDYRKMDNANSFSYTTGQKNTISMVFNNSTSNLNYAGGIVASGQYDMYLNGTKLATWDLNQGVDVPIGTGTTGLWLQIPFNIEAEILVDNLEITAVPEPSSLSFAVAILLAGALRRRRA